MTRTAGNHDAPQPDALFDIAALPPAGPMVAGCCSCGAGIERPLNGPRPACTHPERVAAERAAREFAGPRHTERMAANFARWFVGTGHREESEHEAAYEEWRSIMGWRIEFYEAQDHQEPHGG
ncbi:hypothetical protein [Kitasatospora sp. NPDC086791]|uniref:hypothetical protein n=1 Tax=Kitasatospora sp. NPDC086791 TaxID=3155178 RepID=UPI003447E68D